MKITKLEIKGFKSFPDRTVLEFQPGITSVVGPNGCGKSNILEAIRWAMGEQRARTLRGKKMEDVIFNGSETRKPVGMAEVRLILSNDDGMCPPSMSDYDEIMIARRLFRDGESQYEINNIACRLSDVTDFFLDTGVGRNSYAIIEQGRVDMVVASKPEDRRVLIEEAAGISRYKSRKEAALKKLELTRQNLQRISDVVGEVKRQSSALKRQASRAERYRKLSDRLKELDIGLHAYRCHELQTHGAVVGTDLEKNRSRLLENESQLSAMGAKLEQSRLAALETEKSLKDLLEAQHRTDIELTSVRARIETHQSRIAQLLDRRGHCERERNSAEENKEASELRGQDLEKAKATLNEDLRVAAEELKSALADGASSQQTLTDQRANLDRLKEDIFGSLQEAAQERNRKESLTKRRIEIDAQSRRIVADAEAIGSALKADCEEKSKLVTALVDVSEQRKQRTEIKEELSSAGRQSRERISSLREEVTRREKELAAARARRQSLEEMQNSYDCYDDGVRYVMNSRAADENSMLGPVAELIEVPPEFQKALTAALGDRLGHLVVSSTRDGMEAAQRLKDAGAGRSTFIPVCPRSETPPGNGNVPQDLTSLKEQVRLRGECESLADFLLGNCFVVEDMQRAVEIWEKNGINVDLVTRHGEVLSRHGEITGGSHENKISEVFGRREEIAELSKAVASGQEAVVALQSALQEEETRRESISAELDKTERLFNELGMKEVRLRKDQERLESQIAAAERRLEVMNLEKERLHGEAATIAEDVSKAESAIGSLELKRQELETERESTILRIDALNEEARARSEKTEGIKISVAQLEERARSLDKELQSLAEIIRQHEKQIGALIDEMARSDADEKRFRQELAAGEIREKELMQQHEAQAGQIENLKNLSSELAAAVKSLEDETARIGKVVRELRETAHTLEMESVRLSQMLEGLVEKILERYHLDPRTVEPPDAPPDDAEVNDIKAKLETMGEVNLAAIAESRQTEERLAFLIEQEEDLKKAVESLYATINAINKTTRERFRAAFDSINEKFQEIFPYLFRGGEARLELTDEQDLLETGVDIITRPPGKRIQNMDLLSGGEKALTAVGLIFSIFLTRPSPFCILDEVDAPLDDANLVRFNEMLRKLSGQTQFLVITHNKRSMEEADSLYGVTMEEPGASSVVSVQFVA
ncbi:MAG: chromosome segregation protein SMC [Desulfomonile tiedjei]|nr:chromosome segregation protein SMC [Desulfomonile tiedjei]